MATLSGCRIWILLSSSGGRSSPAPAACHSSGAASKTIRAWLPSGSPSRACAPLSRRSASFACAMSRATMMVPVSDSRVLMGYLVSTARTSFMGWFRLMFTAWPPRPALGPSCRKRAGFFSSSSMKTPWSVIFARTWRSALQETPMPTGQEAPWRGMRMTRTSCTKYLPPNWAPMPRPWHIARIFSSHLVSRYARPWSFPDCGRSSRYRAEASFTVLRQSSAERPPMTMAKW
mmetsp:Transcript_77011/g.239130  ORF Transcript_77011/g.239130 Transcript_77011/m.239130 type:complete len:232 (-) Transcript_77011:983-1678(-)